MTTSEFQFGATKGTASRGSRRHLDGFTLVELLVVIGIIAVLIGILFPVFHRARQQAQQVVCLSNVRQLGLAALNYAGENKGGVLPVPLFVPPPRPPVPYEAIGCDDRGILNWQRGVLWPFIAKDVGTRMRIFVCPSDPEPRLLQAHSGAGQLMPGTSRNFSYCFNGWLSYGLGTPHFLHYGVRITQIHHTPSKLLVVEEEGPASPGSGVSGADGTNNAVLVYLTKRHNMMCNVCYVDGHAETLDPSVFANPGTPNWQYTATANYEHYVDIFSDQ